MGKVGINVEEGDEVMALVLPLRLDRRGGDFRPWGLDISAKVLISVYAVGIFHKVKGNQGDEGCRIM